MPARSREAAEVSRVGRTTITGARVTRSDSDADTSEARAQDGVPVRWAVHPRSDDGPRGGVRTFPKGDVLSHRPRPRSAQVASLADPGVERYPARTRVIEIAAPDHLATVPESGQMQKLIRMKGGEPARPALRVDQAQGGSLELAEVAGTRVRGRTVARRSRVRQRAGEQDCAHQR